MADLAGQREVVAENLQLQVLQGISLLAKNLRDERKKSLNEGALLTQNLTSQIAALERAKRNYEKAFREAEKSIDSYQKADADFNLSRAEVEKQRSNMNIRCGQSEDAKNEYANQLQKTNKLQQTHFETSLPEVRGCGKCETRFPINDRVFDRFSTDYKSSTRREHEGRRNSSKVQRTSNRR